MDLNLIRAYAPSRKGRFEAVASSILEEIDA
jgi:hypothetical protein